MDNLEQSLIAIQKLREEIPDSVNAYLNYTNKVKADGHLDEKQKALITVALSLQSKCEMCISMNTSLAIESGATKDEILEASMLSVAMGGGSIMMYMKFVLAEFED
jgi:AhpD family alkylhydroperoxidase